MYQPGRRCDECSHCVQGFSQFGGMYRDTYRCDQVVPGRTVNISVHEAEDCNHYVAGKPDYDSKNQNPLSR